MRVLLFIIIISLALSITKHLARCKMTVVARKDTTSVKNIVGSVVKQTNSVGVLLYTLKSKNFRVNKLISSDWARELSAATTLTFLNNFAKHSRYFARKDRTRVGLKGCAIKGCCCLKSAKPIVPQLLASDRILMLVVVPIGMIKKLPLSMLYKQFSCQESSPKVLLLVISNDRKSPKLAWFHSHLNFLFNSGFVNVDVVQVTPRRKVGKRFVSFDYRIVQLDTAKNKIIANSNPNGKVTWFKDKVNNYQARRVEVKLWLNDSYANDMIYHDFLKTLSQIVNITFVPVKRRERINELWYYYSYRYCNLLQNGTNIKLYKITKFFMIAPVIFDSEETSVADIVLLHLLSVALVIASIWIYCLVAKFEWVTWSPTVIFTLIFAGRTERVPLRGAELVVLFFTIAIGFFFAGDLTSGITASAFDRREEVPLANFKDFHEHNITVYLLNDPLKQKSNYFYRDVIDSKIRYVVSGNETFGWFARQMFHFKNVSVSYRDDFLDYYLPKKFIVDNQCGFRVSSLSERADAAVITLRDRDPLVHRASDVFWRYFEANLMIKKYINGARYFTPKHFHPDCYKEAFDIATGNAVYVNSGTMLILVAIGIVVPFIALVIENVLMHMIY